MASILLISPDSLWQGVVQEALTPQHSVTIVATLEEGIRHIQRGAYALIIADILGLPSISEGLKVIQQMQPVARIVIVAVAPTWRIVREAFEHGAIDFAAKTFNAEEIQRLIENNLRKTPQRLL